jgi:hypothetical protein
MSLTRFIDDTCPRRRKAGEAHCGRAASTAILQSTTTIAWIAARKSTAAKGRTRTIRSLLIDSVRKRI